MKLNEMKLKDKMLSWSIQYYDVLSETWVPYLFLGSYAYCNREDTLKSAMQELKNNNTQYKLFEHTVTRVV